MRRDRVRRASAEIPLPGQKPAQRRHQQGGRGGCPGFFQHCLADLFHRVGQGYAGEAGQYRGQAGIIVLLPPVTRRNKWNMLRTPGRGAGGGWKGSVGYSIKSHR